MFNIGWITIFILYAFILTFACRAVIPWLQWCNLVDREGERTSHKGAVARGGGLVFIPLLLVSLTGSALYLRVEQEWWISGLVVLGFAVISAIDDFKNLSPTFRLSTHILLAGALVFILPATHLPQLIALPEIALRGAMVVVLVWWVNLYNFMDGIDGLAAVQTITISLGLLMAFYTSENATLERFAAAFVGLTALAFLAVNWHPARLFMGDVGSVTLAAIIGILLMFAGSLGQWGVVLILPLYFWLDATSTLIWRIVKREKVWKAHRQHAYQRYVASGHSHSTACWYVIILNIVLFGLAISDFAPFWARFGLAFSATTVLLVFFRTAKPLTKES